MVTANASYVVEIRISNGDLELKSRPIKSKATFTDLRNLMQNFSTFSLACLFYFTVHRSAKLYVPKKVFVLGSGNFPKACEKKIERKNTLYSKFLHFYYCV